MAVDFDAIAAAIATRFAAAAITPPSGEDDIALSTSDLPDAIADVPTVLVLPPDPDGIEFNYHPQAVSGTARYPVRFYLWRVGDEPRRMSLTKKWLNVLYAQLFGQVMLGLSAYVTTAVVDEMGVGRVKYGGIEYQAITLSVAVNFWEAASFVA